MVGGGGSALVQTLDLDLKLGPSWTITILEDKISIEDESKKKDGIEIGDNPYHNDNPKIFTLQ